MGSFLARAHRDLSVSLDQSQGYVLCCFALLLTLLQGGRCCVVQEVSLEWSVFLCLRRLNLFCCVLLLLSLFLWS
jgi:hypothetical protein